MHTRPSPLPATPAVSDSAGLWEATESILVAALPEFLGALAAALVIAAATWAWRSLRRRSSTPHEGSDGV